MEIKPNGKSLTHETKLLSQSRIKLSFRHYVCLPIVKILILNSKITPMLMICKHFLPIFKMQIVYLRTYSVLYSRLKQLNSNRYSN